MKRVKMAFLALTAIGSIGSAFAFSPANRQDSKTYYAVKTGNGTFAWTQNNPASMRKSCAPTSTPAVCSILTANQPVANQIPAGHSSTGQVYQ